MNAERARFLHTKKQRLVLIHSCIGEQQGRIIDWNARTRRPKGVPMLLDEKVDKGLARLVHGPLESGRFGRHDSGDVNKQTMKNDEMRRYSSRGNGSNVHGDESRLNLRNVRLRIPTENGASQ